MLAYAPVSSQYYIREAIVKTLKNTGFGLNSIAISTKNREVEVGLIICSNKNPYCSTGRAIRIIESFLEDGYWLDSIDRENEYVDWEDRQHARLVSVTLKFRLKK